jgi:hypothetical protein
MEGDAGCLQGVDQCHDLTAGHAEGMANSVGMERSGDDIGNAAGVLNLGHGITLVGKNSALE